MKRSLVTLLFGLLVLAVLGVVQVSLATPDNSVSSLGVAESAPASVAAEAFTFNRARAMSFASKSFPSTPINLNAAMGGNLRSGQSYGNNNGRYCATYLAHTMNAGGIPIKTSFTGNHQILQYLTEKSGGSGSKLTIQELASNIRKNSYVAEVTVDSMPRGVRPGDIVFFNVRTGKHCRFGWCAPQWGADHSAIITNQRQSPSLVRLAYWNVEKYDIAFHEVRKSLTGNYIVVRFH